MLEQHLITLAGSYMENVHTLSLATTLIKLKLKGKHISSGTGFFYADTVKNILYLATNYHVVTGVPPQDQITKQGDSIEFTLKAKDGGTIVLTESLFHNGRKKWLQHPTDRDADLILLPLNQERFLNADISVITKDSVIKDVLIQPSSPVVLIGYPYEYHDSINHLPIWKTGSIASEPEYDFDGKKVIIVDISAFPGMSGSPALFASHGGFQTKSGNISVGGGMHLHFLGIFASMQTMNSDLFLQEVASSAGYKVTHNESLQLGTIWKSSLLNDIADAFDAEKYVRELSTPLPVMSFTPGGMFKYK